MFITFFLALMAEQWILERDMSLTEWNSAGWHFRGFCDDCNGYQLLARTTTGDLCEACDLKHVIAVSEEVNDSDYPPVGEPV